MKSRAGQLIVLGAGGHGRVVADLASSLGLWPRIGFLDDSPEARGTASWPLLGRIESLDDMLGEDADLFVAMGDNGVRLRWLGGLLGRGINVPVLIHPRASVSPHANLGAGSMVAAGAVVSVGARLGAGCIVNTGASVDHDCLLGDGVHVGPGAHVGGNVAIGDRSWIGIGACLRHGLRVGQDVVIGAGAALVRDARDSERLVGVPAREMEVGRA